VFFFLRLLPACLRREWNPYRLPSFDRGVTARPRVPSLLGRWGSRTSGRQKRFTRREKILTERSKTGHGEPKKNTIRADKQRENLGILRYLKGVHGIFITEGGSLPLPLLCPAHPRDGGFCRAPGSQYFTVKSMREIFAFSMEFIIFPSFSLSLSSAR
jgi:hypothetical protein